jgi:phenylpropionate dioxygenase-like ring-hydroxylating dioxygenase large terminal subunit
MNKPEKIEVEALSEPLTFPVEAFISRDYAEAEGEKLWAKVWQQAGRLEEIPEVGSYITYNIGNESILIVRNEAGEGPGAIRAFYNVCPHRGRRLVGNCGLNGTGHSACGKTAHFRCNYHAWKFGLDGSNQFILDKEDWQGVLGEDNTSLTEVKVDHWGGWLWINMDPESGPLRDYLEPIATRLDPFEFDRMRYRFRLYGIFDCNWKVALEAFLEPYHVAGTHPQLLKYGDYYAFSKALGQHGITGFDSKQKEHHAADTSVHRAAKGDDPRLAIAEMQQEYWDTIGASTTETLVNAARRLIDELPPDTPPAEVHAHFLASAKADDAARGVIWPELTDEQMAQAGLGMSIFPNMNLIPGPTFSLYYRVRPYGTDPDKCIFEAVALDRFPPGQEPQTEWTFVEQDVSKWPLVIAQDISNMVEVQRGYKSRGFRGNLPNPWQERKVTNLHAQLAKYMGTGAPIPVK